MGTLVCPRNSRVVEGHVNRISKLRRPTLGRAGFTLLGKRALLSLGPDNGAGHAADVESSSSTRQSGATVVAGA